MPRKTYNRSSTGGPKKFMLLILGMHRSGASVLGGVLSRLGCALSASHVPADTNDDGAALRSQNSTLQTEHDTLKAKLAQFDGAHADLVQIEGQLGTALADLEETRNRLTQTESALAQRRLEAEQTAKEADTLRIERDSAHARVTDLEANETMQARALSELRQQLRDHSDEIVTLEEQRMVQADELSRLSVLLKEAETATNERVEELEQSTQLLSEHGERIAEQDAQLAQIQSERGDLHAHVQFLEDELTAMRSSTLWRMTGPLRAAVNMLRGRR
jgi:chromosome segregation ATPase